MILMAIFALGLQNVSAQDAPLKIVTNHPDFKIKVKRCAASGKTVVLDLILNNEGTNDVKIDMVVVDAWSEAYALCIDCSAWGLNSQKLVKFSNIPITRD